MFPRLILAALLAWSFASRPARGDPFAIDLEVKADGATQTAHARTAGLGLKPGRRAVLKLDKDVVVESALTMDFKPGEKSTGGLSFQINTPGTYLVRVESIG